MGRRDATRQEVGRAGPGSAGGGGQGRRGRTNIYFWWVGRYPTVRSSWSVERATDGWQQASKALLYPLAWLGRQEGTMRARVRIFSMHDK